MPIVNEEKLTLRERSDRVFDAVLAEVISSIRDEVKQKTTDNEKKRAAKLATTYKEFMDLVTTVNLVPFKRAIGRSS